MLSASVCRCIVSSYVHSCCLRSYESPSWQKKCQLSIVNFPNHFSPVSPPAHHCIVRSLQREQSARITAIINHRVSLMIGAGISLLMVLLPLQRVNRIPHVTILSIECLVTSQKKALLFFVQIAIYLKRERLPGRGREWKEKCLKRLMPTECCFWNTLQKFKNQR